MTDPEKQHKNDCSTCDAVRCSGCILVTPTHWRQRKDATATATTTEDAPFSVEEMRAMLVRAGGTTIEEKARAVATAAALERAVETVREVYSREDPAGYYDGEACMDACRLACRGRSGIEGHLVASAIQYLWRSGRKGAALPDVIKARDMVERLVRELGGGK